MVIDIYDNGPIIFMYEAENLLSFKSHCKDEKSDHVSRGFASPPPL